MFTKEGSKEMRVSEVLNSLALFYRRCEEEDWALLTEPYTWHAFLVNLYTGQAGSRDLSAAVSSFLMQPLAYQDFRHFADSHFVGGLPTSILAVESLYRKRTALPQTPLAFSQESGLYDSDHAAHMRYLYQCLGIELAPDNILPPDHLSLLLGFLALLIEHAPAFDSCVFIDEHLAWLPDLLETIRKRAPEAEWLLVLTALLIGYLEQVRAGLGKEAATQGAGKTRREAFA